MLGLLGMVVFALGIQNLSAQPANDNFAARIPLVGTNVTVLGSNVGATLEAGEPSTVFGLPISRSVWWTWTAPARGIVYLTTRQGAVSGTTISVYTGNAVSQLTSVSSLDGDGYFGFQAEAGVTYQIAVSSLSGAEGNIVLSLQFLTPPLNDNFAARQTLTGAPVKFVAWNADASNEPGEPQHWSPAAGRSVWCSWAAPSTGSLMLKATAYQGTPPILAIYRGTAVSSLQRLAASADPGGVVCDVIAGSTYLIAIDRQAQEGSTFVCELSLSTVSISSPASGTIFQAPANIIVEARTTSYDGNVSRVDFFAGAQLLGSAMNQPYRVLWQNPPAGQYSVFARAVSADDDTHESPAVSISVRPLFVPNDFFTNAFTLSGDLNEFFVDNYNATAESGEPQHTPYGIGRSLWWNWNAPFNGQMFVTALQTGAPPVVVGPNPVGAYPCVGIYIGNSVDALVTVTNWANFKTTPLVFPVTAGTTYRFAWDSYVATPESYRVNQSAYATIANDDFANRIPLSGTNIVVSGTTRIATREPGEPGDGDASVWYSWLAPGRGVLRPTVNGPAGSTVTVFTGTAVTNISAIPFVYGLDGELEASVQAGQQYAIRVAAPDPAGSGPFELNLPFIAAPPNDNFSNATVLIGPSAVGSGNTWLATAEPNEPLHAGTDYRRSLWWTWTAPASTKVAVYASGVRFPPVFVVYTGNTLSSLSTVGGSNFTYYPRVFNATAGTRYRIVVASPDFGPGEVSLEIVGIPSNDTFANRAHLAGSFGSIAGNNATASRESGEPTLNTTAIGRTVWYTWTAPASGTLALSVDGIFPPQVGLFSGASFSSLVRITNTFGLSKAPSDGPFNALLTVTNGGTYQIAVDGKHITDNGTTLDTFGPFNLTYNFTSLRFTTPTNGAESGEDLPLPVQFTSPVVSLDGGVTNVTLTVSTPYRPSIAYTLTNNPSSTIVSNLPPDFYSLAALATNSDGRTLTIAPISFTVRPKNDLFANRLPLTGAFTNGSGWISGSSLETGEAAKWEAGIAGSIWWSWTAPASAQYGIKADASLRVFTGTVLSSLSLVGTSVAGYVPFNAVASHTYQLGLGTPANNQSASVRPVTLGIYPQPPNDRFTNAISIAGESMIVPFYTVAATHDSGEPNHAGASGTASVWFNWLAPADGISLLQLSNVNFSAALGVYTGNVVSALTKITNSSQPTSPVRTPVRAGVTYHIAIDGVGASVGEGLLSLQFFPTPLNDFFVDRTAITGDFATLRGDNHLATRESGEPALGGLGRPPFVPQATLWWEWTAPRTGPVRLTSRDSATKLAGVVWVGTQLTNLYALTTLQLTNGESLPVPLQVQAGNKYVISIGTFGEDRGEIGLEIAYPPPPANDNFASRQFLTGSSVRVSGTVAGASTEPGDPSAAPSVWFAWTAPRHGRAVVTVNTDISVYRGTNLSNLTLLVSGNSGKAAFRAGPGEQYQLAVSSPYLQDFVLNLDLLDSPPNDDFAQRATITGSSIVRPVSMLGSTSENEGYIASDDDGDLWWVWTPPWSGPATISCPGSSSIDVYVGDTSRFAQTFTSNDGAVSFQSFYGRLHLIRVAGNQQLLTTLTLALGAPSAIQRVVQADQTTGTFDLNLSGLPRQVIAINASEDLINWEPLGLYMFLDTNLRITDSLARSRRFYQIVPLK